MAQEQPRRPQEQMMVRNAEEREREGTAGSGQLQSLPMESSPYVKYSDLEDYKRQGYGTGGHTEPVETRKGGGPTDAPTLSGSNLTNAQADVVNSLHRKGNA